MNNDNPPLSAIPPVSTEAPKSTICLCKCHLMGGNIDKVEHTETCEHCTPAQAQPEQPQAPERFKCKQCDETIDTHIFATHTQAKHPKQEAYPNLNAGNNNEDIKWAEKWKTPEERIVACEQYCSYLRQGRSKKFYPDADENTIKRYIDEYPEEFRPQKIADAERKGLANLEATLIAASQGKIPGANATLLIWLSKNKLGMRDKVEVFDGDLEYGFDKPNERQA